MEVAATGKAIGSFILCVLGGIIGFFIGGTTVNAAMTGAVWLSLCGGVACIVYALKKE